MDFGISAFPRTCPSPAVPRTRGPVRPPKASTVAAVQTLRSPTRGARSLAERLRGRSAGAVGFGTSCRRFWVNPAGVLNTCVSLRLYVFVFMQCSHVYVYIYICVCVFVCVCS